MEPRVKRSSGGDAASPVYDHEPMQVWASSAYTGGEGEAEVPGLCLYCGVLGHFAFNCPAKRAGPAVSMRLLSGRTSAEKTSSTSTLLPVRLRWSANEHDCQALVDSGAEGNFMDYSFAQQVSSSPLSTHPQDQVRALTAKTYPT